MSVPNKHILSTKLAIPGCPAEMVPRPRLQQPEQSPRLVLVCAPAGYGKTTLIASWAKAMQSPIAWLSLDQGDNDPARFLMHFITAVQNSVADFGKAMLEMLDDSPPSIASLMSLLVNEMCGLPQRLCVALDDLHLVEDARVHEALAFLIQHQPPQLQLMISSRSDPPFSLARIRGQGQLLELRANDLRFTVEETAGFCNGVMRFDLPPAQIESLSKRTEGWIVGLQLAAISLKHTTDREAFITSFAGNDRHITDFLLDEVLRRCSPAMQEFLLFTSPLARFNASLCDAVTERTDSRAMIDELERANMFIFGLDNQRGWYRYHHLFTSLLQTRLRQNDPERHAAVHRRASAWFKQHDLIGEAIDHALAAGDFETAADLIEQHSRPLMAHGQISTAMTWVQRLPTALLAQRPVLSLICAWGNFYMGDIDALERYAAMAEQCLVAGDVAEPVRQSLLAQVALLRGCGAAHNGDIDTAIARFTQALQSSGSSRTVHRISSSSLGACYFVLGRLDDAEALFKQHAAVTQSKYDLFAATTAALGLARVHLTRGRLIAARQTYERSFHDCLSSGRENFPGCGILHLGLGELFYAMNRLADAERHLTRGVELTAANMPYLHAWGRVLLTQTRMALGATTDLLKPQQDAELMKYAGRFMVDLPPVSAAIGRLLLSQRNFDGAREWVAASGLSTEAPLAAGREPEYVVLARFFLETGRPAKAAALLARLLPDAERGSRSTVAAEMLILQALACEAQGDGAQALDVLHQALKIAEACGLLRLFLDEGTALAPLLKKVARGADYTSYAHRLLGHVGHSAEGHGNASSAPTLAVLFSKKERQVVEYIAKGATNSEIAKALFISINTLNSHMKNIYTKLDVNNRPKAMERLRELGLAFE